MIGQQIRFNKIQSLLPATKRIRNVSIVAHVDHGKTTLADCLIASNGIIHKKQAGHLKLLDDRLDQQNRGITMKSSSICLLSDDYLINLIDSPGHSEFYCEVSAALRLTDSALLVVDAVEGVSSQTFRVLNQLYREKLPSILVLNKIDRLVTHCKLDPMQAYGHINQIIQQINAVLGAFITKEIGVRRQRSKSQDLSEERLDHLEDMFYFSHTKQNIIFGAALDNWGFAAENFASLLSPKMGLPPEQITKYLWGDYYYSPRKKQFSEKPFNENNRPLCVDYILQPIWDIFEAVQNKQTDKINKIITKMGLKISENAIKAFNQNLVREILNAWLPLDKIVLSRIISVLPDPVTAQKFRLQYLLSSSSTSEKVPKQISEALQSCSITEEQPLIVFISKMVNIAAINFNEHGLNDISGEGKTRALGFGRIFSGKINRGDKVYLITPKKQYLTTEGSIDQEPEFTCISIENLYIFNAQYPEGVKTAYAGNIVGIGSVQNHIFKSGTLSTAQNCISFTPVASQTKAILKVSVSTPDIEDNQKLLEGLKKLNKSDPSVEVYIDQGDIVLGTCGQVHLEKCVVDLESIYCKVPVKVSEPIINCKETIVWTNPSENNNQRHIEELRLKQREIDKKLMMAKLKEEMKVDAELDETEKEKLKAIKEWDSHVEIYESEDLTTADTRFFFKNRDDEEEDKFNYKDQKIIKKTDHKNKGKKHLKQKFLNLNLKTNVHSQLTPNQLIRVTVRSLGMAFEFAQYLEKNSEKMRKLFSANCQKEDAKDQDDDDVRLFLTQFADKMKEFGVQEKTQDIILSQIVCFGPNGYGPNILCIPKVNRKCTLFQRVLHEEQLQGEEPLQVSGKIQKLLEEYKTSTAELLNSIISGFSIACSSGPLCNEPMIGVIFIVEDIERVELQPKLAGGQRQGANNDLGQTTTAKDFKILQSPMQDYSKDNKKQQSLQGEELKQQSAYEERIFSDSFGPLSGQIISTVKDACIEAFMGGSPRLVEPMYLCELHTDQQYYGQIHNQLSKRRAKIVEEDLHEFSNVFIIKALLPIIESFKFCFQILDKTQGTVNAQLNFETWKVYAENPFYTPQTEQQIEEDGLESIGYNSARLLLEKLRQKKGLATTEKIVTAAEKQRTLKKN